MKILLLNLTVLLGMCNTASQKKVFTRNDVLNRSGYHWQNDSSVIYLNQNTKVNLAPVHLKAGRYTLTFSAKGEPAGNIDPEFFIDLGYSLILNKKIVAGEQEYKVNFQLQEDITDTLLFEYANASKAPGGNRSVYLCFPITLRPY